MTVLVILLTPVLLLAIVALFAFVGCSFRAQISLAPVVATASAGTSALSATLGLNGGELLVATLQWDGLSAPTFKGAQFQPAAAVNNGNALKWNGMSIQVFTAVYSGAYGTNINMSVTLPTPSQVPWSFSIWPYSTNASNPLSGAVSTNPNFAGKNIQAPAVNLNKGDALYAVAFAADTTPTPLTPGIFPGNSSLSAPANGPNGETVATATDTNNNPLLEGWLAGANEVATAQATNTPTDPSNTNPKGFILALGVTISS
ncbi:MAG TPA: hypothetical protein VL240_12680 [Candidatus Binatia bacterium]|nr:hypothetical protein [Candidatus Binatia bacterium]